MATRPTPGGSDGTWGTEYNAHLAVSLAADGKIKDGAVFSSSTAPTVDAGVANKKYVDDTTNALVLPSGLSGNNDSAGTTDIGILKLEWGSELLTANQDKVISTTGGFTKIFQVICSYQTSSTALVDSCSAYNYSSSGFNLVNSLGVSRDVSWLAIGR